MGKECDPGSSPSSDRLQGSLGIPRIPWLERLRLQTRSTKEYLFYDTSLNDRIENAFQALALDEVGSFLQIPNFTCAL